MTANRRRNWKCLQPSSLRQALELCKEYAREKHNRSIERIAEMMGLADHWSLYKWLENGRMPLVLVPAYENACGIDFVTRWLAARDNKLLVDIPTGRVLIDADVVELHSGFSAALGLLTAFYAGQASAEATLNELTAHMGQIAFHHANVAKHATPEFEF